MPANPYEAPVVKDNDLPATDIWAVSDCDALGRAADPDLVSGSVRGAALHQTRIEVLGSCRMNRRRFRRAT